MEQFPTTPPPGPSDFDNPIGWIAVAAFTLVAFMVRWLMAFAWRATFGKEQSRNADGE